MKSLFKNLVVIYNEIEDAPKSAVINPSDGINY